MFGFEPIEAIAGGDIRTARFIKPSTAADATLLECDANEMAVGISAEAPRDPPLDGADATEIAEAGGQFEYYTEGHVCLLQLGSGGATRGAQLKSDADGKGVLAATTGATMQWCGAIALESASEDELCKVLVKVFPIYPALA